MVFLLSVSFRHLSRWMVQCLKLGLSILHKPMASDANLWCPSFCASQTPRTPSGQRKLKKMVWAPQALSPATSRSQVKTARWQRTASTRSQPRTRRAALPQRPPKLTPPSPSSLIIPLQGRWPLRIMCHVQGLKNVSQAVKSSAACRQPSWPRRPKWPTGSHTTILPWWGASLQRKTAKALKVMCLCTSRDWKVRSTKSFKYIGLIMNVLFVWMSFSDQNCAFQFLCPTNWFLQHETSCAWYNYPKRTEQIFVVSVFAILIQYFSQSVVETPQYRVIYSNTDSET